MCDVHLEHASSEVRLCIPCTNSLRRLESDFSSLRLACTWFDRARSVFSYEGRIRDVLHGFKYEQRFDLVKVLVKFLAEEAAAMGNYDVVVPVPLHRRRMFKRGYNQSALLARPLAKHIGAVCDVRSLIRADDVGPQVGRELKERLTVVKGIFRVQNADAIQLKNILLIDDVLTTGATVNECARVLKKAGAKTVHVLTVARTC